MKYLKGTIAVFIATLMLSVVGANAATAQKVVLEDITIPVLSKNYMSSQKDKWDESVQAISRAYAKDNVSGDGRDVRAKVHGMFHEMIDSEYVKTVDMKAVEFDEYSKMLGGWKLYLKSNKSLLTTAKFSGAWRYGWE